uniref:Uncharacterized protein n=1 Tax=Physcomitrium patens TaxID=3218 RepID=A0A2K1JTX6_PHYPA|nr:hypothetical protein PHYPA_014754 [Physcomitrium patens]
MDRAQGWRHHLIPLPYWPPLLFSPPDQSRPPLSFPGHYERWRFPLPELLLPSSTVIFRPPRSASQGAIELVTRWTGKVHGRARGCSGWLAWLGPRARWKTQIIPSVYPSTNEINTPLIHSEQGLGVSSLPIACAQSFRPFIRRHVLVSQFRVGRDLGAASLVSVIRPLSLTGGGDFVDWGGRISWMAECHLERPVEGPQWCSFVTTEVAMLGMLAMVGLGRRRCLLGKEEPVGFFTVEFFLFAVVSVCCRHWRRMHGDGGDGDEISGVVLRRR